jgi:perosamine synthetase
VLGSPSTREREKRDKRGLIDMEAYEELELELCKWCGVCNNHASESNMVVCSSGTAALHLALESLMLPEGSGVIIPDFTMIACARAVTLAGLVPIMVDVDDALLMDLDDVDDACKEIGPYAHPISAIMAVHTYGRRVDMEALHMLAQKYSLCVVEDLAECHGVRPHPETHAACWSFYRNKIVHGEEGGAILFAGDLESGRSPRELAARARCLRSLGFTGAHDFTHVPRGHNYRLSNTHARLIQDSLAKVSMSLGKRRLIASIYDAHTPLEWRMPNRDVVWVYDLHIPGMVRETQDRVVRSLQERGVQARHGFKPISGQEEYRTLPASGSVSGGASSPRTPYLYSSCLREHGVSIADRMSREVIYLPVQPNVPDPVYWAGVSIDTIHGALRG